MMLGLVRQVGVQAAGAVFCAAVSFGLVLGLGRALGTADFGRYVLVLNLAALCWIVIEAGWPTLLYRQAAQQGSENPATGAVMQRAVFHVVLASSLVAAVMAALPWADAAVAAVAVVCMGAVALMNLVSARLRAAGRFALEAGWQSAGRVASAALIVLVLALGEVELVWVFAAWALGLMLVLGVWGRRWLLWPGAAGLPGAYRAVLPFMWMAGLSMWLLKGDVVLIGVWGGDHVNAEQLSWYAAGTRLTEVALLLAAPVGNVLLGRFSAWGATAARDQDRSAMWRFARRVTVGMVLAGVLAVGLAWAAGPWLMSRLFGAAYAGAGVLLPWMLLMLPFALGNVVLFALVASLGQERRLALGMGAGGILLAGLVPGLSAIGGVVGAAQGVALAHAVVFIVGWALAQESRG